MPPSGMESPKNRWDREPMKYPPPATSREKKVEMTTPRFTSRLSRMP